MTAILAFVLSPVGRYVTIALVAAAAIWGWGEKRFFDGRASYKAQIQGEINATIKEGTDARERALNDINAGRVPDRWFRD